ncbi:hypothetical protein EDD21DRAFT_353717 [Dissophora ornata]|nr:hypothetical protein EDD21DRAFT_353717 [Dissophora ornata]
MDSVWAENCWYYGVYTYLVTFIEDTTDVFEARRVKRRVFRYRLDGTRGLVYRDADNREEACILETDVEAILARAHDAVRHFVAESNLARQSFVGHLERQATELILQPRFKTTVDREKERGITAIHKKAKYPGPRGEWRDSHGYVSENGYCPSGGRLEDHEVGICPGPTLDPHDADQPAGKEVPENRGEGGEDKFLVENVFKFLTP